MLLEQSNIALGEIKEKTEESRFFELVKQYEDPVKATVHRVLEQYTETAFEEFMHGRAGQIVRRESDGLEIKDYRNGSRIIGQLPVDTMILNQFRMPRNRAGGFKSGIVEKFRRRAGKISALALELFVNGVSTRKVRRAFERIGMKVSGLSKSTVSNISKELVKEYTEWINRPLKMKFEYLQTDAVYLTTRKFRGYKIGTLMIIGISADGGKEVLYFTLGSESEKNIDEMIQNLIRRGLDTAGVKLITADGSKGPINSIVSNFGKEKLQRCTVHKTRNVLDKCPKNLHDELKARLNRLWNQSSRLEAEQYLVKLVEEYEKTASKSIDCLLEDKEDLLRYFEFPESHRKTIRNTNLIERVIHEVRRRTKVMGSLGNEFSCYGITMGIVREQNERWSKRSHWRERK